MWNVTENDQSIDNSSFSFRCEFTIQRKGLRESSVVNDSSDAAWSEAGAGRISLHLVLIRNAMVVVGR
jgi:hypothetical protein